ncbi:MAG: hypothetical protein M3Y17_02990 [Actinomycetota bacterium]|nr:hypothetical protein [Actinomycetota bacterium]
MPRVLRALLVFVVIALAGCGGSGGAGGSSDVIKPNILAEDMTYVTGTQPDSGLQTTCSEKGDARHWSCNVPAGGGRPYNVVFTTGGSDGAYTATNADTNTADDSNAGMSYQGAYDFKDTSYRGLSLVGLTKAVATGAAAMHLGWSYSDCSPEPPAKIDDSRIPASALASYPYRWYYCSPVGGGSNLSKNGNDVPLNTNVYVSPSGVFSAYASDMQGNEDIGAPGPIWHGPVG